MKINIEAKSLYKLGLEEIEKLNTLAKTMNAHPFQSVEGMYVCKHKSSSELYVIFLKQDEDIVAYWIICFR